MKYIPEVVVLTTCEPYGVIANVESFQSNACTLNVPLLHSQSRYTLHVSVVHRQSRYTLKMQFYDRYDKCVHFGETFPSGVALW